MFLWKFWKKSSKLENLIFAHLKQVEKTMKVFEKALLNYLDKGNVKETNKLAFKVHKLEGQADDKRRKIETQILGGAMLASSRAEMMGIIERVDKLANLGEAILDSLLLQEIEIPKVLAPKVKDILEITLDIFEDVKNALRKLFTNRREALDYTKSIEIKEGKVDKLERDAIKLIFSEEISLAEKLLIRDFLLSLTDLSDRAEDLSDRLEMAVAQRIV